jgi:hypothetical protein
MDMRVGPLFSPLSEQEPQTARIAHASIGAESPVAVYFTQERMAVPITIRMMPESRYT